MRVKLLVEQPYPVLLAETSEPNVATIDPQRLDRIADGIKRVLVERLGRDAWISAYRAVGLDRLGVVLTTGIDVEPPDAPFFSTPDLSKALEYGGYPKLILVLAPSKLTPSWLELPGDTQVEELQAHRITYPTMFRSEDSTKVWLSRLRESDPRAASPYEAEYGHWIPHDAKAALRAVVLLGDPQQVVRHLTPT